MPLSNYSNGPSAGTAITAAVTCQRRAWLQERVAGGPGGEAALVGQLSHLLLQRSLHAALAGTLRKDDMMAEVSVLHSNGPETTCCLGLHMTTVMKS